MLQETVTDADQALLPDLQPTPKKRRKTASTLMPSSLNPVARVVLASSKTALLDREFDFWVPEKYAAVAQPGVRVRVPFRGQLQDGFVVARLAESDHAGELAYVKSVVSPERVLSPSVYALVRAVAAYYAGTTADVLRFAVPPRHARADAEQGTSGDSLPELSDDMGAKTTPGQVPARWRNLWNQYRAGATFIENLADTPNARRYVWTPLPGLAPPIPPAQVPDLPLWAAEIAVAVAAVVAAGRPALIVAPDVRDVERILTALMLAGLGDIAARLVAEDGPEQRYRAFLAASRGKARVVVGTRAAAFAPLNNLGLLVLWGDGEDTLLEPQTPYYHAREVLALRGDLEQVPLLVGGIGREVETQLWVAAGTGNMSDGNAADGNMSDGNAANGVMPLPLTTEVIEIAPSRATLRARAPRVRILDQTALTNENHPGRIPSAAWRVIHDGLARGPVLVQVPRGGYLPGLACANCRQRARCPRCHGPLQQLDATQPPTCLTCGFAVVSWRCPECQGVKLRSVGVGAARTAEELGRAFPGVRVITSAADSAGGVRSAVDARGALVIATPGAEPVASGGYAAAVLLDAGVTTAHIGLDAEVHALRRWLAAAHLVVPGRVGGQVVLVGDAPPGPAQALVMFEPAWFAQRQLDERLTLGLPPATRAVAVSGDIAAVTGIVKSIRVLDVEVFGPIPIPTTSDMTLLDDPKVRALIRVPRAAGAELAQQLKAALITRAAKREPGKVKIHLDPAELLENY